MLSIVDRRKETKIQLSLDDRSWMIDTTLDVQRGLCGRVERFRWFRKITSYVVACEQDQFCVKLCEIVRDWGPPAAFRYELPRLKLKFGERSFSFSGPKAWNSLPSNLQELTNTDTFKKLLKTHLFKLAFGELEWLCWCTIGHCRCNWRI